MTRFRTTAALLFAAAGLMVAAPAATAQESAGDAYGGQGQVLNTVSAPSASAPSAGESQQAALVSQPARSGQLPFTGLDVTLLAFGGLLLLLVGLGVRRLSRDRPLGV